METELRAVSIEGVEDSTHVTPIDENDYFKQYLPKNTYIKFEEIVEIEKHTCSNSGGTLREKYKKEKFFFLDSALFALPFIQELNSTLEDIFVTSQIWSCCVPGSLEIDRSILNAILAIEKIDKEEVRQDDATCCRCPSFGEIDEMASTHTDDFVARKDLFGSPYNPDNLGECRNILEWSEILGGFPDTTGSYITHTEGDGDDSCANQEYCVYKQGHADFGNAYAFVAIACRPVEK